MENKTLAELEREVGLTYEPPYIMVDIRVQRNNNELNNGLKKTIKKKKKKKKNDNDNDNQQLYE